MEDDRASAPQPPALRASDADREKYADVLREAFADGRLDREEYDDRLETVYRAKTYSELAPLVADLPTDLRPTHPGTAVARPTGSSGLPVLASGSQAPEAKAAVAIMSGAERRGAWIVPEQMTAVAIMGGVELDLTAATLAARVVEIRCFAFWGGISITVPAGVEVRMEGHGFMGGMGGPRDPQPLPPGSPVVRITGLALMGGVEVKRPKPPLAQRVGEAIDRFESGRRPPQTGPWELPPPPSGPPVA